MSTASLDRGRAAPSGGFVSNAQEMSILGEELGDRDLPLPSSGPSRSRASRLTPGSAGGGLRLGTSGSGLRVGSHPGGSGSPPSGRRTYFFFFFFDGGPGVRRGFAAPSGPIRWGISWALRRLIVRATSAEEPGADSADGPRTAGRTHECAISTLAQPCAHRHCGGHQARQGARLSRTAGDGIGTPESGGMIHESRPWRGAGVLSREAAPGHRLFPFL
jgi:hypothetical protein